MKRPGLLAAALSTTFIAVFAVKAAGWFDRPPQATASIRPAMSEAERWYRSNQTKHWRAAMLHTR